VVLDEQRVQRQQTEDQPGDDRDMRDVQPDQRRAAGGEVGGEPDADAAEQLADLQVVAESLEAFLVPLEHGSGEQRTDGSANMATPMSQLASRGRL
jgi:hypothetical protein